MRFSLMWKRLRQPPWRTGVLSCGTLLIVLLGYALWSPGRDLRDGRHDLGKNGIWLGHGWLGDDEWFVRNHRQEQLSRFRDRQHIRQLAALLREHHIQDVYPHLCPTDADGYVPAVHAEQTERFLDEFGGFRVLPWIGGVLDKNAFVSSVRWRKTFARTAGELLHAHPRLAGVHVNIEPMPSGEADYLILLDQVRADLPPGKILSVAAYPPPTYLQPGLDVHWERSYFGQVGRRADQLVVMMYDTALHERKIYQNLMAVWTQQVIDWAGPSTVLLGVPAYEDRGVGWHDADVENLGVALPGVHAGLGRYRSLPPGYQGIALYSEWEMTDSKWRELRARFLAP